MVCLYQRSSVCARAAGYLNKGLPFRSRELPQVRLLLLLLLLSVLPDKAKIFVCSRISLALSFWMKHLVIGQLQKPAKFSAFHWSTPRSQAFIGQLLGTSRVAHLSKRTLMVLFTISDA